MNTNEVNKNNAKEQVNTNTHTYIHIHMHTYRHTPTTHICIIHPLVNTHTQAFVTHRDTHTHTHIRTYTHAYKSINQSMATNYRNNTNKNKYFIVLFYII